jgi:hypothetical protein
MSGSTTSAAPSAAHPASDEEFLPGAGSSTLHTWPSGKCGLGGGGGTVRQRSKDSKKASHNCVTAAVTSCGGGILWE